MLFPGKIYHIYNRANGHEKLFIADENYEFFKQKVSLYILPVADLYCYCLLPNHFHFLVRIKNLDETILHFEKLRHAQNTAPDEKIEYSFILAKLNSFKNSKETLTLFQAFISKQFAKLFSSYTQAFNKKYKRMGSMFMKNFKRKEIDNNYYLSNIIKYIHKNPIHHGLVNNYTLWKWSSYQVYLQKQLTIVKTEFVISWFGSREAFIESHKAIDEMTMNIDMEFG